MPSSKLSSDLITDEAPVDHPSYAWTGGATNPTRHVTRVPWGAEDRVACQLHVRATRELVTREASPGLLGQGRRAGTRGPELVTQTGFQLPMDHEVTHLPEAAVTIPGVTAEADRLECSLMSLVI